MKVCVVGPGALGCLFAAFLARAGHEVVVVDRHPERARLIAAQGIVLHEEKGRSIVPVRVTAQPDQVGEVQLALLCVKSDDVTGAVQDLLPSLASQGLLIGLQNGIAHHQRLTAILHHNWALGVTAQGANLLGPGMVRHGGSGPTTVGFLAEVGDSARGRLVEATALLNRAGIPTTLSRDIQAAAWNKLIINAGINALTVMEGCANGELLHRPAALATLEAAVREAAQVAVACGIRVAPDPVAMTIAVCRDTQENISSMLQDIRQGRHTEVEAINGAIISQAQALRIPVPVNQALLAGVKAREAKVRTQAS